MGQGATQGLAPDHAGQLYIGAIGGCTGDLGWPLDPANRFANSVVGHRLLPPPVTAGRLCHEKPVAIDAHSLVKVSNCIASAGPGKVLSRSIWGLEHSQVSDSCSTPFFPVRSGRGIEMAMSPDASGRARLMTAVQKLRCQRRERL